MKRLITVVLFVLLGLWGCDTTTGCLGDFAGKAYAASTLVSDNSYNGERYDNPAAYRKVVYTTNAANDITCFDTTGYRYVYIQGDLTTGTLNADVDRCADATCSSAIVDSVVDDKAADWVSKEVVVAQFYCVDLDTCTACSVTLTTIMGR